MNDQLRRLLPSSVLVFEKRIVPLQIMVSMSGKSFLPSFPTHLILEIQWKSLNVITLGPSKNDYNPIDSNDRRKKIYSGKSFEKSSNA